MELEIRKEKTDGITVLKVSGAINAHTVNDFEAVLQSTVAKGEFKIIIDCQNLDYISSAGLGALMGVIEEVKQNGGDIILCNTSKSVYRVFDILGFTELFKIFDSLEKSIEAFNKNE